MKINGDLLIDDNLPLSCVKTNKNDIDNLKGTILFNGSTTGGFTLNDSIDNYTYLDIYYSYDSMLHSVRILGGTARSVDLFFYDFNNSHLILINKRIAISGKNVSVARYKHYTIADNSSWIPYGSSGNPISVHTVIGYKSEFNSIA